MLRPHRIICRFHVPLRSMVEVRNQARVHLWFEAKFPLSCTAEALERFTSAKFVVGVGLQPDDRLHIEAPFGLTDLFALRLRLNPRRTKSASPGLLRMCDAAGLKSSLRTSHRSGTRDGALKSLPAAL